MGEIGIKQRVSQPKWSEETLSKFINREPLPISYKIIELNTVNPAELGNLRESIARNGGNIDVMVHPYYQTKIGSEIHPQTTEYKKMRDEFIKSSVENERPLIIFEEKGSFNLLSHRINAQKGTLYVITTTSDSPNPFFKDKFKDEKKSSSFKNCWEVILDLFKNLGVYHITVGGRYLLIHQPTNKFQKQVLENFKNVALDKKHGKEIVESGLVFDGCVGVTIGNFLLGGMDVSISPISSPSNSLKSL